ncbi:MAG TPA: hypothetical protein PLE28_00485 [bacterium]|nr:hypothetical protein [bacterium]
MKNREIKAHQEIKKMVRDYKRAQNPQKINTEENIGELTAMENNEELIEKENIENNEESIIKPVDDKVANVLESVVENKTNFNFYSRENAFLGEDNKDLSELKDSDKLKQLIEDSETKDNFHGIISDIEKTDLQTLLNNNDFRKQIELIADKLGLSETDIIEVLKNHEDNIVNVAKMEILKAENASKKKIKIGKLEIALSDLARVGLYTGAAMAGSAFFGVGGLIGVTTIRIIDQYFSKEKKDKNRTEAINAKVKEIKTNIDHDKVYQDLSSATFIKGMEKWNKDFFAMDKAGQEIILNSYVDLKYPNCGEKRRKQLLSIYNTELRLEKNQIDKETAFFNKKPSLLTKAKNLLLGTNISNKDKVINSTIAAGALLGLRIGSQEVPILKNVLGAYVGWNLGGLAYNFVDSLSNKKEKTLKNEQKDVEEDIIKQIENIREKYKNLKELDEEYQIKKEGKNNKVNQEKIKQDIKTKEQDIGRELDQLKIFNVQALILLDDFNFKKNNPEKYLRLQEKVAQSKSYIRFLEFKFKAEELNDLKEEKIKLEKKENKLDNNVDVFCKYSFRIGGALIGAFLPELVHSFSDNHTDNNYVNKEDLIKEVPVETSTPSSVEVPASSTIETPVSNPVETPTSSSEVNTVINRAIGETQKTVVLESGDGVSKIFDGHMGGGEKVTFIDAENGKSFVDSADKIIVHAGDKVVLGADGNINVILNNGVSHVPTEMPNIESEIETELETEISPEDQAGQTLEEALNSEAINLDDYNEEALKRALESEGTDLDDYNKSMDNKTNILGSDEEAFRRALESEGTDLNDLDDHINQGNNIDTSNQGEEAFPKVTDSIVANTEDIDASNIDLDNNLDLSNHPDTPYQNEGSYENVSKPINVNIENTDANNILNSDNNLSTETDQSSNIDNSDIKNESVSSPSVIENNNEYEIKQVFKNADSLKEVLGDYGKNFEITEHRKVIGPDLFTLEDTTGQEFGVSFPDRNSVKLEKIDNLKKFLAGESNNRSVTIHDKFSSKALKDSINILNKEK